MSKISSSPQRHTFQAESTKKKLEKNPDDEGAKTLLEWYDQIKIEQANRVHDPEWQKNNLEYDLRPTQWILAKVRASEYYAQNLYAALCNNSFQKIDVLNILKEQEWSCSWRHAGGIIADMRQAGDYIDWYCSGIRDRDESKSETGSKFVSESIVTDEIRSDLLNLGWRVVTREDEE